MNAVYWLYTTITKHSKKVDCQSKLLQNENQPEFQPTDVTFWAAWFSTKPNVSWEFVYLLL